MIDYPMNIAKREFSMGYLKQFQIIKQPVSLGGFWNIALGYGENFGYLVDARSKQPRIFKTLDATVKALEEIGFKIIKLESF